jgi:hypothetical protein
VLDQGPLTAVGLAGHGDATAAGAGGAPTSRAG